MGQIISFTWSWLWRGKIHQQLAWQRSWWRERSFGWSWSFPVKLKLIIFLVDGLTLWTGAHLHIKCDSHYFMFLSANSASQHSSMFSSICLLSIDQPSRASVCLASATSSSSSGNYLAALRRLLIFMSTCRNICFGMSFVNASSYLVSLHVLSTFTHSHKDTLLPLKLLFGSFR